MKRKFCQATLFMLFSFVMLSFIFSRVHAMGFSISSVDDFFPEEKYPVYTLKVPHERGQEIFNIQRFLQQQGLYAGSIDGIYGSLTAQGVAEFRQQQGLSPLGVVDSHFYQAMSQVYEEKMLYPAREVGEVEGEIFLVISVTERTLYAIEDNVILARFPVGVGKPATPSPLGEWRIINKGSKRQAAFGSRWMGLNVPWGVYGIHGTNNPFSIGGAMSGGCIRMFNRDVIKLFQMVEVGAKVFIIHDPFGVVGRGLYSLHMGSTGSLVYAVQRRLRQLEYYTEKADGVFGWHTYEAVKKFQEENGLEPTGRIDYSMYEKLGIFPFE